MSTTSKVAGTSLVPKGGEDIFRLVEARRGKNFFYHRKNSLMRYNIMTMFVNLKYIIMLIQKFRSLTTS